MYAIFGPLSGIMQLNRRFDKNNVADLLILYHELHHVAMNTLIRQNLLRRTQGKSDAYWEMLKQAELDNRNVVYLYDEVFAWAGTIELANLLVDNDMKNLTDNNKIANTEDINALRKKMGLENNAFSYNFINNLMGQAQFYFNAGLPRDMNKRNAFTDRIKAMEEKRGNYVFDKIPGFKLY